MVAHPILASLVLVAGLGGAAITITYTTTSDVTTASTDPPVQYFKGDDTNTTGDYIGAFTVSTNKTYFTATVNGVPEANLTVGQFFRLKNVDNGAHTVTLSTSQVSDADVSAYKIGIFDVSTDQGQGVMDLTAASPSVQFTMAAGEHYYAKLYLELASGATPGGLSTVSPSITLTIS